MTLTELYALLLGTIGIVSVAWMLWSLGRGPHRQ